MFGMDTNKNMHWKAGHPEYQKYWDEYYTFSFVRNPWDRFLSAYLFSLEGRGNPKMHRVVCQFDGFSDFIENIDPLVLLNDGRFEPQINYIVGHEFCYIGKVEDIDDDWKVICNHIGMEYKNLPILNTTNRVLDYQCFYNTNTKEIIEKLYKEDIKYFGYRF